MKSILSISKKWNRLMELIGTPITVFIFLSWADTRIGITPLTMSIFFTLGVLIGSPNFSLALVEAILGSFFLYVIRDWFLYPINLPFLTKPFCWWHQQTACAGVVSFFVVILLVKFVVQLSLAMQKQN